VTRVRTGRWIAAAALAAALAAGACLWLASEWPRDEGESGARTRDAAVSGAPAAGPTARRAAAPSVASEASDASVEIDDAPLPEGATGTIRGTVRDDTGRPVAKASVAAVLWHTDADDSWPEYLGDQSAEDGTYAIEDLDPSVVWGLEAHAEGHARVRPAGAIVFSARRLEVTHDVVLPRNGSLEVVALDAVGSPVQHTADVLRESGEDSWGLEPESLEAGRYRVLVHATGLAGDSRVVDVTSGEVTRVEFRLGEAVEISGVLLDSDGAPVRRVEVVAVVADAALAPFDGTAETAADGSFRIAGLRRTRYRLALADVSLAADAPEPVLAPATGVALRLRDESKVTFRLVYPPGFPAADRSAEVAIWVVVNGTQLRPSPRWDDDQGTVRVPGGEDAELAITALHCATVRRRCRVRPGELLDLGAIQPELARDVEGRVVDAGGAPVPGAEVRWGSGAYLHRAMSGADGSFLVERVPQSGVALDVACGGFVSVRVPCPDGATTPLAVTLARGGVLWARAEAKGGAPLAGAAVRLTSAAGESAPFAPTTLDGHGECATRLPPGRWRIAVAGCAPVDADVREGATTSVRLRPSADGR
jgi:carboxypeptidase family protein